MDSLLIAHMALWVLVAGLFGLVLLLSRQLSILYAGVAPAGALAVNAILEIGQAAPVVRVESLENTSITVGGGAGAAVRPEPHSQLLIFLAPDCPISRSLTPVLASFRKSEPSLQLILASDGGSRAAHQTFSDCADLRGLPYVLSEALGRAYGISKLPYAVLIDEQGFIAGMGIVNSREHLESLFEAKESGVSTIQEFMNRNRLYHEADVENAD